MLKNPKKLIALILIILATIALAAYNATAINPKQIKTREIIIKDNMIKGELKDQIVVFFSDLHYSDLCGIERVFQLREKISAYDPAVVIFGGDLCDKKLSESERSEFISELSAIASTHGKFAVLGDEDSDEERMILEESGFMVLSQESTKVYFGSEYFILFNDTTVSDEQHFSIAAEHIPDDLYSLSADLLLAGHCMGPQVNIPLVSAFYRPEGTDHYTSGKYKRDGSLLYVTNGVGVKNKNIRFMADAEIVAIRLSSEN